MVVGKIISIFDISIEVVLESNDIKVGDILVFQTENMIITHRVIEIINDNNEIIFRTKGDNNNKADLFLTKSSDVLGVVKCKVKYIGYPTIWLTEIFEENK